MALRLRRPHRGKHPRNCAFTHTQRQKTPPQRNKPLEPHHSALICHSWVQSPSQGDARRGCGCKLGVVHKLCSAPIHPWRDSDRNTAVHYLCSKAKFLRDVSAYKVEVELCRVNMFGTFPSGSFMWTKKDAEKWHRKCQASQITATCHVLLPSFSSSSGVRLVKAERAARWICWCTYSSDWWVRHRCAC